MSVYLIISENGKFREINNPEMDGILRKIREGKVIIIEAMGQSAGDPLRGMGHGAKGHIPLD